LTTDIKEIVNSAMGELAINYAFMEYKDLPKYPYFVGEYQESDTANECGMQEGTFILTGFTRNEWQGLEDAKAKIENHFNKVYGKTVIADSGNAVAVFYANSLVIPTGDADIKKIQINLAVKEWKVN
jgi:hypothetical protein